MWLKKEIDSSCANCLIVKTKKNPINLQSKHYQTNIAQLTRIYTLLLVVSAQMANSTYLIYVLILRTSANRSVEMCLVIRTDTSGQCHFSWSP